MSERLRLFRSRLPALYFPPLHTNAHSLCVGLHQLLEIQDSRSCLYLWKRSSYNPDCRPSGTDDERHQLDCKNESSGLCRQSPADQPHWIELCACTRAPENQQPKKLVDRLLVVQQQYHVHNLVQDSTTGWFTCEQCSRNLHTHPAECGLDSRHYTLQWCKALLTSCKLFPSGIADCALIQPSNIHRV